jgi:KDO2-lipid IV(A) lauroyltransferase
MRAALAFGLGAAGLARLAFPKYRRMVDEHLAKAFPGMPAPERARLAREVYRSAARCGVETAKGLGLSDERFEALIDFPQRAFLEELHAKGGMLMSMPHQGNWEFYSRLVARNLGFRLVVIAREQKGGLEALASEIRRRNGLEVLHRGQGLRPLARALREGAVVGSLPDQAIRDSTVPTTFFGHPAMVHDGLARLALLADVPLVPTTMLRRRALPGEANWGGFRYEIRMLDPIQPRGEDRKRRPPEDFARDIAAAMEELIRQAPEQWMWFHDRWRVNARKSKKAQSAAEEAASGGAEEAERAPAKA